MINKKTKFGLPYKVIHCKNCLMTNQKPFSMNETKNFIGSKKNGLQFDDNNICAACNYSKTKAEINWQEREKKLSEMLSKFRRNDGRYDCIISGSGGKDSMTQAHILKYKYGMHPLTVTFSPLIYTKVGFRNLQAWIKKGGFDNLLFSPNGKVTSLLAKESFKNLLHPIQPFKFGIKTFAAKMALKYDIELIIYGEPYAEYGSQSDESVDSPSYSEDWFINDDEIFISGLTKSDLIRKYQWLESYDFLPFEPLRSSEVKNRRLHVEFLGWYIKWDPQSIYYYASENCGYEPDTQRSDGTYGKYAAIDDKMEWLHYYLHYIKFGIGRCRFDASQEIRSGHITRDEGIALCKKFEGNIPNRYLDDCFGFMKLTREEGMNIIDSFRPDHLWKKTYGKWQRLQENPEFYNI